MHFQIRYTPWELSTNFVSRSMEDGTKSKKTVFVGGVPEDVDEAVLYEHFSAFGALNAIRGFLV
jgi:RNA recognition motif-containing protein